MNKTVIKTLAIIIALSFFLPIRVYADEIDGAFSKDEEEFIEDMEDYYDWDPDKFAAEEWNARIDGEDITFQRESDYQREYLTDLIQTTLAYTGNSTYVQGFANKAYGSGRGGSQIIEAAMAELGTTETFSFDEEGNVYGNNDVPYNDWYYGRPISGASYEWCVVFVSWCADQCGLLDDGSGTNVFMKAAGTGVEYQYLVSHGNNAYAMSDVTTFGGGGYTPKPGDIFFLYDSESGLWQHIGFIAEVHEDYLVTIEGNWSNQVSSRVLRYGVETNIDLGCIIEINYPSSLFGGTEDDQGSEEGVYAFCRDQGLSHAAACGVLANIAAENSTFDTGLYEEGNSIGYGLCQWSYSRRDELFEWLDEHGYDRTSFEGQMYFMFYELTEAHGGYYSNVYDYLLKVNDTEEGAYNAAYYFCFWYEAPGDRVGESVRRANSAREVYFEKYKGI